MAIVPALPSSSVVLIRDGASGLEVLMVERAKTMKFAPGAFVFPGGKVDEGDCEHGFWSDYIDMPAAARDLSYRIAGLRELYEEASVFIASASGDETRPDLDFRDRIRVEGATLGVAEMELFAHWVTPEPIPRRFNTFFYLVAHNGEKARHDGNEAVSYRWVNPEIILEDWENDKVPLMFPTRLNLLRLAEANTVDEAFEQARQRDVVKALPALSRNQEGVSLTIPEECGFGITEASEKELAVETSNK